MLKRGIPVLGSSNLRLVLSDRFTAKQSNRCGIFGFFLLGNVYPEWESYIKVYQQIKNMAQNTNWIKNIWSVREYFYTFILLTLERSVEC